MDFLKRISDWLGISPPKQKTGIASVGDLIELGRQARYQENYANALDIFEKSVTIATAQDNATALAIAQLNIADTYIQMERYDEAEFLLNDLETSTEERQHYTPLAYTLCLRGYLHQTQDQWDLARDYYTQAVTVAEKSNASGAIGRAKGHLAITFLREGNATYAEHLLREALPLLDETNDIELASQFIGHYALTLIELGREADGDRLLATALQRAQRLNFVTEIRYWHRILGERELEKHNYQSALKHYQDFLELSPDPLPQTEEYGLALSNLSEITRQLGEQDEALAYALEAEKILTHLDSDLLSSHALMAIGLAMRANQQFDEALTYFTRATESIIETSTDMQLEIAKTHTLASHYDKAETAYQALLDTLDEDDDSDAIATVYTGLGNVYQAQNQLEKAIQQWMQAFKIYERQSNHNLTARIICDMAQARYQLGDGKRALSDYERALMLLNSVDKETRGIVMANAAIAYADKGDVPTTESFFSESIEIARELGNTTAEALRRNNYAAYLIDIGHAQRAIISLEHALKLIEEQDNPLYTAIFTDNMGFAYRTLNKPEKALSNHQTAQEHLASQPPSDWHIRNQLHLVETYLDLDHLSEASKNLPELTSNDINTTIQHHLTTARFKLDQADIEGALQAIQKGIHAAQSGYRQRLLARALLLHSKILAKANQKEEAIQTWESAEKLLTMLQMPKPNPDWLHIPSDD